MCEMQRGGEPTIEVRRFGQRVAGMGRRAFLQRAVVAGALMAGATAFAPEAFTVAAADASRKITVLTCMDYRIDPLSFTEIHIDDAQAYILRNAGGRVDEGAIRSIIVTQQKLGARELFVVHHTDCGMATFENDAFNLELLNTFNYQSNINFLTFGDLAQSVRDDIATLQRHPLVDHTVPVSGYIYDVTAKQLLPVSL